MKYLNPENMEFHLDSFEGHVFEAYEELDNSEFTTYIYPSGDCSNPVISTADIIIDVLDRRLEEQKMPLLFDNIRPAVPEFGENVLVYPIENKHLPKITPLDKITVPDKQYIKHPVYWVFKGDSIIDSGELKRSKTFRNLVDFASSQYASVKLFDKKDLQYFSSGDYGVYFNPRGLQQIETYRKIGKPFKPFNIDHVVPKEYN